MTNHIIKLLKSWFSIVLVDKDGDVRIFFEFMLVRWITDAINQIIDEKVKENKKKSTPARNLRIILVIR